VPRSNESRKTKSIIRRSPHYCKAVPGFCVSSDPAALG
jgi:hypothetical protein